MNNINTWINKKLPSGSFARNVVTLMTGTTFAQSLLILIAPILTRLYTPEDFGVFALYTSILAILTVISCLRYELAIVLPEKDEDAANILALSILVCTGLSLIVLILVVIFGYQFSNLLDAPQLAFWLWFLPLSLLVAGLFQAFNYWSIRRKQFKRLAVRQITQSSVTAATQVTAGATIYSGAGGLISGHIAGQATATGRLVWQIWKDEGKQLLSYLNMNRIKSNLVRYKQFPIYSSWSSLLNTASIMMPPLLLGFFFTPAVVGFYALGHRVLKIPMSVMGGAVSKVFFPRATEAKIKGDLDRVTFEMFKHLVGLGLVPILLLTIVAPELFSIVFGGNWFVAGEYVRWISVWIFFQFVSAPISTVYLVLEKQRDLLIFNIILLATCIPVFIIGGLAGDALFTIKLFGITGGVIYFGFCVYILYIAEIPISEIFKNVLEQMIKAIPYIIIPLSVLHFTNNSISFIFSAIFSAIAFMVFKGRRFLKDLNVK